MANKTKSDEPRIWSLYAKGDVLLLRTVTFHYIGRLDQVLDGMLVLSEGGWLADSIRWAEGLETGKVNEFEREPGPFVVMLGGIIDARIWAHPIPATK